MLNILHHAGEPDEDTNQVPLEVMVTKRGPLPDRFLTAWKNLSVIMPQVLGYDTLLKQRTSNDLTGSERIAIGQIENVINENVKNTSSRWLTEEIDFKIKDLTEYVCIKGQLTTPAGSVKMKTPFIQRTGEHEFCALLDSLVEDVVEAASMVLVESREEWVQTEIQFDEGASVIRMVG